MSDPVKVVFAQLAITTAEAGNIGTATTCNPVSIEVRAIGGKYGRQPFPASPNRPASANSVGPSQ